MKKHFFRLLIISLFLIPFAVFADSLPTNTFTTNYSTTETKNYMYNALRSKSMTSPFIESFAIPYNLKTYDGVYPLYILSKNLGTPNTYDSITPTDANPMEVTDAGINYILTYGYNANNQDDAIYNSEEFGAVTNESVKQYITQIALWLYIYQNKERFANNYCANGACDFLNSDGQSVAVSEVYALIEQAGTFNKYQYMNYIIQLVDRANVYKKDDSQLSSISGDKIEYTVQAKEKRVVTNLIHPTPTGNSTNFLGFTISIEDPYEYGVYIVDEDGQRINDYSNMTGSFRMIVPFAEDIEGMNLGSVKLHITGSFIDSRVYDYYAVQPDGLGVVGTNPQLSHIIMGIVPTEEIHNDYSLMNFVKITTLDNGNSPLAGATMVLTKKGDANFQETWVTEEDAHFFQLDNGEYTLCETQAPEGHAVNTECIDFRIDGESVTVLNVKIEPSGAGDDTTNNDTNPVTDSNNQNEDGKVVVPNTAFFQNKLTRIIGFLAIIGGFIIFGIVLLKNENKA